MNCTFNPRAATSQELLEFYNQHNTPMVKRFSDRRTAERRCQETVDRLNAAQNLASIISASWAQADAEVPAVDHSASNARIGAMLAAEAVTVSSPGLRNPGDVFGSAMNAAKRHPDASSVSGYDEHGLINCPHCGTHLSNGVGIDRVQEVNGRVIKHDTHKFACLGCGEEFGPALKRARAATGAVAGPRPAMSQSLKLDRRILHVSTGVIYENACRVWKADLVSASQGDRLSALLYGAAKQGIYAPVTVNGHEFKLVAGGAA